MTLLQTVSGCLSTLTFIGLLSLPGTSGQTTGCRETWVRNSNTHAAGGTKFASVTYEEQCFSACVARPSCVAVEIDTRVFPADCWLFGNQTALNASVFFSGYNQYILQNRCPQGQAPVCRDRWELQTSTKASGTGTFIQSIDNVDQCLNTCLLNQQCVAVDIKISTNPLQCYLHTSQSDLQTTLYTEEYKLYVLIARCDNLAPNCWTTLSGKYADNGIPAPYNTTDTCKQACLSQPNCLAVDVDSSGPTPTCWLHYNPNDITPDALFDNPNVTEYQLNRTCAGFGSGTTIPSTYSGTTVPSTYSGTPLLLTQCWQAYPQTQYVNGISVNANDVATCQGICLVTPSCFAVDYDSVNPLHCWIHNDTSGDLTPYYGDTVTQYRLINCTNTSSSVSIITTTLPTSTPTSTQGCWTVRQQVQFVGGQQANYNTVDSCKAYCYSQSGCFAIDYDSSTTPPCWVHITTTDLTPYAAPSVTQYLLDRTCSSSSSTVTALSSTSGPAAPGCWTVRQQTQYVGGQQVNFYTVESCKTYCYSQSGCFAVDLDSSTSPPCWIHITTTDLTPYGAPSVTQYLLDRTCSSSSSSSSPSSGASEIGCWFVFPQTNYDLGSPAQYFTPANCQAYCASLPNCVGIDYDTSANPPCWIHTDPNDLSSDYQFQNPTSTHYRPDRVCLAASGASSTTLSTSASVSNPSACWLQRQGVNSLNGIPVQFSTLQSCQVNCISYTSCVAVDYDSSTTPPCWIHNNSADIQTQYNAPSVVQYILNRTCLSVISSSSTISVQSSTSGPSSSSPSGSVCWVSFPGIHSIGGSPYSTNNVTSCQAYCAGLASCVAVDFSVSNNPPCWYHTNPQDLLPDSVYNDDASATQYQIDRGCQRVSSSTTAGTGSTFAVVDCWTVLPNFFSDLGTLAPYNTLDACKSFCLNLPRCIAIDYDTSTMPCWYHTDPNDFTIPYYSQNVTQYRLNRTCADISGANSTVRTSTLTTVSRLADCPRWNVFPQSHSTDGNQANYNSLSDCLNYCDATSSCVAIDYDTSTSPPCWVHQDPNDLLSDNVYFSASATQYQINRGCSGTIATGTTTTSGTTTTTTSTTTAGSTVSTTAGFTCPPRWIRYSGRNSLNAVHLLGVYTVNDCLNFCQNEPMCVAFDFDLTATQSAGCWIHYQLDDLWTNNTYYPLYEVAQYVINRTCLIPTTTIAPDCMINWSFLNNTSSSGGLHYFQYRTVSDCQQLCVDLQTCVAVDFDTRLNQASGGCYVYNDLNQIATLYSAPGVQQYRNLGTTNCQQFTGIPGCSYQWSLVADHNVGGGVPTRDTTVLDCQMRCIRITNCLGIDIDSNLGAYAYCWLQVQPGSLTPLSSVNHYNLTRGPGCPESNVTTPSTVTTTPSTPPVTGPYGACSYYYEIPNANANGGVDKGVMSSDQCLAACILQYPFCVAVDWRKTDSRCFFQNSLSGRQWNGCCTRYELLCYTGTCNDSFAYYPTLVPSLPGFPQSGVSNLTVCQNACYSNSSCVGFTFARTPRYQGYDCVLSFSPIGTTTFAADNDLYIRRICHPTVAPTGTVTPPPTPPPGYCVLDIVFVVDNSGSIIENEPPNVDNLALLKDFMRTVIQPPPIQVGPYFDHVGIIKFETSAFVLYDLCNGQTLNQVIGDGINGIPTPAGETNTPEGLRFAYNMLYSSGGCARPNAQKVVILITDGQTTAGYRANYTRWVEALKAQGTTNIAIGITDEINVDDLINFASLPSDVGTITGFDELLYEEGRTINRMLGLCGRPTVSTLSRPRTSAVSTISNFVTSGPSTPSTITSTAASTASTTATSTSTSTSTSTTTPTTTTTVPQPVARPFALAASRNGDVTGPVSPVPLNVALTNVQNSYDVNSYTYTTPSIGIYYAEICIGLRPGQSASISLVQGGSAVLGLAWFSTIHNGTETACRAGLLQLLPSATQYLSLDSGAIFSSNSETMLNVFSVSDSMTDDARARTFQAVANASFGQIGAMQLSPRIGGGSNVFDPASNSYICTSSGLYFFSFTAGSNPFSSTRVTLTGLDYKIEITRNTVQHNGITTLSRSALMPCTAGTKVWLNVTFGDVVDYSSYRLITFSAFPYLPRNVQSAAWVLLKDYSSDTMSGPMDPFYFSIIAYNANNLYNDNSRTVTIQTAGYYYIYLSSGLARNHQLNLSVKKNGVILFLINHQTRASNAEESVGHGMVVALNVNDVLKVVGDIETYSFASDQGQQVSFFGMLLYSL